MPNWTLEQLKSTKAGAAMFAMGGLAAPERKPSAKPALDQNPRQRKTRQGRVVIRCSIIACRRRLLDDDNATAGAKPLRDAIAKMFGLDDDDARIRFEYGQMQTNGTEGTIVKLERL